MGSCHRLVLVDAVSDGGRDLLRICWSSCQNLPLLPTSPLSEDAACEGAFLLKGSVSSSALLGFGSSLGLSAVRSRRFLRAKNAEMLG